jgi:hypothetical protein
MKSFLPLVALILFSSTVFANSNSDQKWTCRINKEKSKQALYAVLKANPGKRDGSRGATQTGLTTVDAISAEIKDGQLVDGQIVGGNGFDENGWRFTEPSPSYRNAQEYSVSALHTSRNGKLRFEIGSHGWDHFTYTVTLDPATGSATISEYGYFDCGSPGAGVGVLDCERQ